jgi:hypothetical protein
LRGQFAACRALKGREQKPVPPVAFDDEVHRAVAEIADTIEQYERPG